MGCCAGKSKAEAEEDNRRKIVVVGDGGVGKTCLIRRYINGEFDEFTPQAYIPSSLETHTREMTVGNKKFVAIICDTGGQETFRHLRKTSYPNSDAVIVCFSLDNEESLKNIHNLWIPEMQKLCPRVPMILVGNKLDLREEAYKPDGFIKESKGLQAVKKHKMVTYLETSSLNDTNVDKVFETAMAEAAKRKKQNKKSFDDV
ncbi:ras-like GTP-binding protein Rho1 isoform X2 [Aplysia californica]|uniref:Ras-like GTP-binding protein Rho1 isoform X2 n=1 Tax=Aplysia californica TaxID=6500 RepID=A0ABM1A3Y5_APLCA|nr:ras-like GTP-binding protein Rho1 isoform X2 [Aplysia californica]